MTAAQVTVEDSRQGKRRDFIVKDLVLPLTSCMILDKSLTSGSAVQHHWGLNKAMKSIQLTVDQFRQILNFKKLQKCSNKPISYYTVVEDAQGMYDLSVLLKYVLDRIFHHLPLVKKKSHYNAFQEVILLGLGTAKQVA